MSVETRNICLNTYDINNSILSTDYNVTDVTTSVGTIGAYFNYMTWQNINLRTLLGDSYFNKYNAFSIKLIQCLVGELTYLDDSIIGSQTDSPIEFKLEGLPFKNYNSSPYNFKNINTITNVSIYTGKLLKLPSVVNLSTTTSGTKINVETTQPYIFAKPATDGVTLTIHKYSPSTQEYLNKPGYGHFKFVFEICGVQ